MEGRVRAQWRKKNEGQRKEAVYGGGNEGGKGEEWSEKSGKGLVEGI